MINVLRTAHIKRVDSLGINAHARPLDDLKLSDFWAIFGLKGPRIEPPLGVWGNRNFLKTRVSHDQSPGDAIKHTRYR